MSKGTRTAALVATVVLGLSMPFGTAGAGPANTPHLPDIQTLPPSDLRVDRGEGGRGTRELRLTNTIWNPGDGPLELRAENTGTTTVAYQRVYTHDASDTPILAYEREVGTFEFHPAHNHWHFLGFARYELRQVSAGGGIGRQLRVSDKVSFCIIPTSRINERIPHGGWGGSYRCGENAMQGLPVGWGDDYHWTLAGQSIDITGLPEGRYWLVSTADVEHRLQETDESNNRASILIRLTKRGVKRVG
jgi:hypothetical protein